MAEFNFLLLNFQAAVNNCSQLAISVSLLVRSCSTSSDLPLHPIIDSLGKTSVSVLLHNMKHPCSEQLPVFQRRLFHLYSPCHIFAPLFSVLASLYTSYSPYPPLLALSSFCSLLTPLAFGGDAAGCDFSLDMLDGVKVF